MTRNELIQLIYSEIDSQSSAAGKYPDWKTAQESVMQQILQGVIAGIDTDVMEQRDIIDPMYKKINEIIAFMTWMFYMNDAMTQAMGIRDTVSAEMKIKLRPTELIQPLT
jgi:hypothetical protein